MGVRSVGRAAGRAVGVLVVLTSLALLLGGCFAVSLRPLYLPGDLIYDPALVGVWSRPESKETWTFTRTGEKEYRLLHTNPDGKPTAMVVHLMEINGDRYLDLAPVPDEAHAASTFPLVPVHAYLAIERMQPTLRLSGIDYGWLDRYLKSNPGAIRHERVRQPGEGSPDQIVLTGTSRELQNFVRSHQKMPGAFGQPFDLARRAP